MQKEIKGNILDLENPINVEGLFSWKPAMKICFHHHGGEYNFSFFRILFIFLWYKKGRKFVVAVQCDNKET